jgi:hypothetical protein
MTGGGLGITGYGGPTGNISPDGELPAPEPTIGPILMSRDELKAEAKRFGQPIYWAGPKKGFSYEFTRTKYGDIYVRYLPQGVGAGAPGEQFLIVATYPFLEAYASIDLVGAVFVSGHVGWTWPHGHLAVAGPHRSLFYSPPGHRKSVLIAFRGADCPDYHTWVAYGCVDYEIEVYDPGPDPATVDAQSGRIRPVG